MITKEIVNEAYKDGVAILREIGRDGHDVVCYIGDYWFRFAGPIAQTSTVDEFLSSTTEGTIVDEIFTALLHMAEDVDQAWFYDYFTMILTSKYGSTQEAQ